MAITFTSTQNVIHSRRQGDTLVRLHPETSGGQVKLTARNGVSAQDAQAELEAIHSKIDGLLLSADAMQFKGVLNAESDLPTAYEPGWTWKVGAAGTYKGAVCEVGDMLIAIVSRAGSGHENGDFAVVQSNIDGAVTGPASAADGNLAAFDQNTGKVVRDSGLSAAEMGKVWVKTVDALPEAMPVDLKDGGLLIVDGAIGV